MAHTLSNDRSEVKDDSMSSTEEREEGGGNSLILRSSEEIKLSKKHERGFGIGFDVAE